MRSSRRASRLSSREQQIADFRQAAAAELLRSNSCSRACSSSAPKSRATLRILFWTSRSLTTRIASTRLSGQRQELDLPQRRLRAPRHRDDSRRGCVTADSNFDSDSASALRIAGGFGQALAEAPELVAFRRRELDQRVDEEAITLDRSARGPPTCAASLTKPSSSRSDTMLRIVAGLKSKPGLARQRARAHGLAVANYCRPAARSRVCARSSKSLEVLSLAIGPGCDNVEPAFSDQHASNGFPPLSRKPNHAA